MGDRRDGAITSGQGFHNSCHLMDDVDMSVCTSKTRTFVARTSVMARVHR